MLPRGWKARLVNLPQGDTEGVRGLCLDPHDLAISKYYARREKDLVFNRELARRGFVKKARRTVAGERSRCASSFGWRSTHGSRVACDRAKIPACPKNGVS